MQGIIIIGNKCDQPEEFKQQFSFPPGTFGINIFGEKNPLLADIDDVISDLNQAKSEIELRIKMTEHLRDALEQVFKNNKNPGAEPKVSDEQTQTEFSKSFTEKIDEGLSNGPKNPQLAHLKKGVDKAIKMVRGTKLAQHFKDVRRMNRMLSAAVKPGLELTEMERIARIETAIGEALGFLQTSKLAARTKVLKEVKKILEDTIDRRNN